MMVPIFTLIMAVSAGPSNSTESTCTGHTRDMYRIIACDPELVACAEKCGGTDTATCEANTQWCHNKLLEWKQTFGDCVNESCDVVRAEVP